jgi:hypothetical protein
MGSAQSTSIRRGIVALAAVLLLAVLAGAGSASAEDAHPVQDPPPVSCIADSPADPLGPGFLLKRG